MKEQTQITVFGANGRVGRLVVREALGRGYAVVAFVHHPGLDDEAGRLRVVVGDVRQAAAVDAAIHGSVAVVSALGSWGTASKDILSVGMQCILPAMEKRGVSRIVSLTGADARGDGDALGAMHRITYPLLGLVGGKVLADAEKHMRLLASSNSRWTVIRSPVMSGFGSPTRYRLSGERPMPWRIINRRAVARSMLDQLDDTAWIGKAPYIL